MLALTIFSLLVLFFSVIIHEIAHGSVALWLGDTTAQRSGRLTLNPLKHIDFWGTIFFPLFLLIITAGQGPIFGWAKPVPINSYNFRDQKWGILKVSLAGPLTNFLIAIIFGLLIRFGNLSVSLLRPFGIIVFYNIFWGMFNLLPIPPLDGAHILFSFLSSRWDKVKLFLYQYGFIILIIFIFVFFGLDFLFLIAEYVYYLITGGKSLSFF